MAVAADPGGGVSGSSIEDAIKNLVQFAGPSVRDLSEGIRDGYKTLLDAAHVPDDWPVDAKASAIVIVIQELVDEIRNDKWRLAARAAFRLPATGYTGPECDSREGRWKTLAQREGLTRPEDIRKRVENYRDYWRHAAPRLASDLERRLRELNRSPAGWDRFRTDPPLSPASPLPLTPPISFESTEVLYEFSGRRGIQATSHRVLRAHEPVDHYDAVGWYYNEPRAPVKIIPLANCTSDGEMRELPRGGVLGQLKFSHVLAPGELYYFAYITRFNSEQPTMPTILYEVRGKEMRNLTVRAQFDFQALPERICYFDLGAQDQGWEWPEEGAPEWIDVADNGFVEHRFDVCQRGRQYGLKWAWPGS
jgi:hypothetical protein